MASPDVNALAAEITGGGDPSSPNAKDWTRTSFRLRKGVKTKKASATEVQALNETTLQLAAIAKGFSGHYVETALIQLQYCSVNGARETRNRKASTIRRQTERRHDADLVAQIAALDARKTKARNRWKMGMKAVVIKNRKKSTYLEEMAKGTSGGKTGAAAGAPPGIVEEAEGAGEPSPTGGSRALPSGKLEPLPLRSQSVSAQQETPTGEALLAASASTRAGAASTEEDLSVVVKSPDSKKKGCVIS
jgi:hypothetical protein